VMIGDTDHDADVAADLGTCAILVASGHQSERRLRATGRPVVSDLRGLTDVLADIE
jgi:phosphoglycolate phosphatase